MLYFYNLAFATHSCRNYNESINLRLEGRVPRTHVSSVLKASLPLCLSPWLSLRVEEDNPQLVYTDF